MKVGFIGGGVMAEAIISGMLDGAVTSPNDIIVSEILPARRDYLSAQYKVNVSGYNSDVIRNCELIILAIKPQDLSKIYSDVGDSLGYTQSVISIVAGATLTSLSNGLKHDNIIRVMPNTPAQIREGMTMWTCTPSVIQRHRNTTGIILSTIGDEIYVDDEKYMDMATALSGSGPAYMFLIIESLINAGVYVGLPRDVSRRLVLQTVKGSVELIAETRKHPSELNDMVTSPGGTTVEGLLTLERAGVPAALIDAVNSAYLKSKQLGNL